MGKFWKFYNKKCKYMLCIFINIKINFSIVKFYDNIILEYNIIMNGLIKYKNMFLISKIILIKNHKTRFLDNIFIINMLLSFYKFIQLFFWKIIDISEVKNKIVFWSMKIKTLTSKHINLEFYLDYFFSYEKNIKIYFMIHFWVFLFFKIFFMNLENIYQQNERWNH